MAGTEVVVGRIGKPHGVKGEVSVELRTDEPERRFADGAVLRTQAPQGGAPHGPDRPASLTVRSTRWHQSRLLVTFEEVAGRNVAEAVRGLLLAVEVDPDEKPEDPEEFYDHQLVGLRVVTADGAEVGELAEVVHGSAQDLLSVKAPDGREILVPFVSELVPEVDVAGGRVVVHDLPGLLAPAVEDEEGGA
ncbi:MAG TPA: ribosome maturation factor RimM [Nocardioidaceae bacterium]|nr:ribosome maturation factor RimM [Nocardioidaceae bacterium]